MDTGIQEAATDWLDKDFIQDVLRKDEDKSVVVEDIDVKKAVGKGDNYASLLYRVGVEYYISGPTGEKLEKNKSLIVKCMPAGEIMKKFLMEAGIFPRETKIYSETLPEIYSILDSSFQPGSSRMAPRILPCDREDTLVLEDLRESGFKMSDRHAGLDLNHSILVLKKLARLHAASVVLHARDPQHVESYDEFLYNESQREKLDRYIPATYITLGDIVAGWGEGYGVYAEKLKVFGKGLSGLLIELMKPKEGFLKVLTHGDCWVNNVLFKYGPDGEPVDLRFVDFQMTRYASPATDLQYFFYSSVRGEVRERHWKRLMLEYVFELGGSLAVLGIPYADLSLESLEKEFDWYAAYGLVATCNILCAVLADPAEAFELDDKALENVEQGDTSFQFRALNGKRFKAALQKLLPHFVEKGVL